MVALPIFCFFNNFSHHQTVSTGYLPIAVSSDSMTAEELSKTAHWLVLGKLRVLRKLD